MTRRDYFVEFMMTSYSATFVLGEEYLCRTGKDVSRCRFIKVTRKGFNFLNIDSHKCVMPRHLYAKKFYGKEIPQDEVKFTVRVGDWWTIEETKIGEVL